LAIVKLALRTACNAKISQALAYRVHQGMCQIPWDNVFSVQSTVLHVSMKSPANIALTSSFWMEITFVLRVLRIVMIAKISLATVLLVRVLIIQRHRELAKLALKIVLHVIVKESASNVYLAISETKTNNVNLAQQTANPAETPHLVTTAIINTTKPLTLLVSLALKTAKTVLLSLENVFTANGASVYKILSIVWPVLKTVLIVTVNNAYIALKGIF